MSPRGIRNNNFGNIEDGSFARGLPGYTGTDGRFATFDNPDNGWNAMDQLLSNYGRKGLNTPNSIIGTWAPTNDGNNVNAYAGSVSKAMGLHPDATLDMNDPAVRKSLAKAMADVENGPGPMRAAFAGSNTGNNPMPAPYNQPEAPSLSAKFISGGPGALFGAPQGVFRNDNGSAGYDVGSGLEGAGAYLMGINNPAALAAVSGLRKAQADVETKYDPNRGMYVQTSKTGGIKEVADPNWRGQPVPEATTKALTDSFGKANDIQSVSERAKMFSDAIRDGKLDLGLSAKGAAAWQSAWGTTSPQSQLYNDFDTFKKELANLKLNLAKGPQTDQDASRAYGEFESTLGGLDNATTSNALDKVIKKNAGVLRGSVKTELDAHSNAYNNPTYFKTFKDKYDTMDKFYGDYEANSARQQKLGGFKVIPQQAAPAQAPPSFKILGVQHP